MCPTPDERPHVSDTASLITLRSILDIEIARSYEWDAATIIAVSGVDRAGDLTTRIVEYPGALADIASEGFSPHSAAGHALSHELHDAIQRRVRLWIAEIPTEQLPRLREALGDDLIHEAGQPRDGYTPVALSPLDLLERWAAGTDEQREFMRVAMAGLDTLTTSSHATHASRAVGASSSNAPRSCDCAATPSSSPTSSSSSTRWREPCPSCTSPTSGATGASCGPST